MCNLGYGQMNNYGMSYYFFYPWEPELMLWTKVFTDIT